MEVRLVPIRPGRSDTPQEPVPFWDETHEAVRDSTAHRAWYITDHTVVIGLIGATDLGRGVYQVGYGVAPSREGVGVATRAVVLLLDLLRNEDATTAVAQTFGDHAASRRVMEKAGMRLVDTRREVVDGEERDLVVYEIGLSTDRP